MKKPNEFTKQTEIPDIFTMEDGTRVNTKEDWNRRRKEIKQLYEYYMYGPMPDTSDEIITYTREPVIEQKVEVTLPDDTKEELAVKISKVVIHIQKGKQTASFQLIVTLPYKEAPQQGYPFYSEMAFLWGDTELMPSNNCYYAAKRGYASAVWLPTEIAADNASRTGAFYTLYPYGKNHEEQTGALAAWGWGAGKILNAMEQGLAKELNIDWKHNILGGVSRFGKATAVAGAYDERIKVVVPSCSGAGGLAMYRYHSEGKTYDFSSVGYVNEEGTSIHTTETNEFLACLQSTDEGHWFNDTFKEFECVEQIPMDQHFLSALTAAPDRYLFIIHSVIGEDWTNPASMTLNYVAAKQLYDFLGLGEHIKLCVHLKGHAIIPSDMEALLYYCDFIWYGKKTKESEQILGGLGRSVFLEEANYDASVYKQFLDITTNKDTVKS